MGNERQRESESGRAPEIVASVTKDRIRESLHFANASCVIRRHLNGIYMM